MKNIFNYFKIICILLNIWNSNIFSELGIRREKAREKGFEIGHLGVSSRQVVVEIGGLRALVAQASEEGGARCRGFFQRLVCGFDGRFGAAWSRTVLCNWREGVAQRGVEA